MGPLTWDRFAALLPEGKALAQLRALVRQLSASKFVWDLQLILKGEDVPGVELCRRAAIERTGRLGQTVHGLRYSGNGRRAADADDLTMNVESIRLGSERRVALAA
jgi:predicted component of type VI protein secretion system